MPSVSSGPRARLLGIIVLAVLFGGVIGHSIGSVRYAIDGTPTSELGVTRLSLTHSVARAAGGKLTNPYAEKTSQPSKPKPRAAAKKTSAPRAPKPADPKLAKRATKPAVSITKPAVSKPAVKKPAPRSYLPKKPAVKKPAIRKPLRPKAPVQAPVTAPTRPRACPT
jgi:hypothetical protein